MRKYEISKELELYIIQILKRGYYHWDSEFDEDANTQYIYTNCPPDAFRKVVARTSCEKETEETGLCHITLEESKDMFETEDILQFHNADAFVIADADECPEWLL